jgi:WD40 repeat protein/serine/threonine protein kinase
MPADQRRARELFLHAVGKLPAEQWDAYVAEACGPDADLQRQVEHLLKVHREAGSFLERPAAGVGITGAFAPGPEDETAGPPEGTGTLIGPYRLLEQIGEGGFGVVYMAEQQQPVRRKVALKVLKPGMDTQQVVARFEAERQALALMDHPNIARVFDGGATASGRPYFVMELVRGAPITEHCDRNHLAPRERLELFPSVCAAVQHAHQKGIIHRDLKPSNVLVTEHDVTAVVKVIDFGIAKALGQQLTDRTLCTGFTQMLGTPAYMAPEQAGLSGLDVDTRSDVYSLGVLLYELLTGTTPFDQERFRRAGYDEICRIIREEEPPRPSTRVSTLGQAASTVCGCRQSDPGHLRQLLRGEVDWIVMKCLDKDRNRRYETANGLARDIERYLRDEPVLACPPSAGYRLRKLIRRNRRTVLAGAIVLVALLAATAISTWLISQQWRATLEERDHAVRQRQRAERAELDARRRFYAGQIFLAHQAWEAGNPARALELLECQRPGPDEADLRSFEWYYLWRLCHQGHRLSLRVPGTQICSLSFSRDGKTLAAGSRDAAVRLWEVATGRQRATFKEDGQWAQSMAFAPDGKTLLALSHAQPSLRLWDLATGQGKQVLEHQQKGLQCLALSVDGQALATGGHDGTIKLWDVPTWAARATLLPGHKGPVQCLAFSPDRLKLASASAWGPDNGDVKIWDLASRPPRLIVSLPRPGAYDVAFSPDGRKVATSGNDKENAPGLYDVATGRPCVSFQGQSGLVYAVGLAPDGKTLASGGSDRTVRLWDTRTGQQRACYADPGPVQAVRFHPGGKLLASAGPEGTITLRDVAPAGDDLALAGAGACVAFSPDGRTLASAGSEALKLWEVTTWKERRALRFEGAAQPAESLAYSHDGKSLAVARGRTLKLFDVKPAQERDSCDGTTVVWHVAFSPDDSTLVSAQWGVPAVTLWDTEPLQVRTTLTPHPRGWARVAAFSPDGRVLATGSQFGVLKLWDAATGEERAELQPSDRGMNWVFCVAFSPDGKLLASGDRWGTVKLWDVSARKLRLTLEGHTQAVLALAFTPDGRTLAVGGEEKTVKLWDVTTGQERMTLKGFKDSVRSLAFAPDSSLLAAGSWDGTVRVWQAATEAVALARKELGPAKP